MTWRIFWTLIKLASPTRTTRAKRAKTPRILYFLLILIGVMPTMFFLYHVFDVLYVLLSRVHQEGALLGLAVVSAQLLALLFGFIIVITSIYMSRDLESLLTLPISPSWLMTARLVYFWLSDLWTLAVFVLPAFVAYGVHTAKPGVWIELFLVFLLLPVTPLLVAFALSTLFMRVTNVGRVRDMLRFIGGILGIGIYVLIQLFLRSNFIASQGDSSKIETALTGPNGILHNIGTYFPPSLWAANAIILPPFQGGLKYWLYVILLTVFLIGVGIWFSEKIFLKSYIGSFEGSRKQRKAVDTQDALTAASHFGRSKSRSVMRSLYAKEFKTFFRSPTLTMNSIASMIITTFAILVPSTAHSGDSSAFSTLQANGMLMSLLGAAGVFFLGTLTSTAGTSISREGSNFFILKSLPIRALDYVMMKWWFANLFAGVAGLVVTGVLIFLFNAGILVILVSLVLGFLPCMAYNAFSLLVDLSFPKLDWTNEQAMMKGIKNFFLVFGEIILSGILAAIGALLHFFVHMPWIGITILYAFLFACIAAIGISLMRSNAEKLMRMIE